MHSVYARINNVSAMLSSCLMTLLAAIALSSFVFTADPKGDLLISSVKVSVYLFRRVFRLVVLFILWPYAINCWGWQHVALLLLLNLFYTSGCASQPIFLPQILTVVLSLAFSFVGHDRRYSHRTQQYAFVNFNISAGAFSIRLLIHPILIITFSPTGVTRRYTSMLLPNRQLPFSIPYFQI